MSLASALLDILGPVHFEPIDQNNPSEPCPRQDKAGDAFIMAVIQFGAISCAYEDKVLCAYPPDGNLDAQRSDMSRCFDTIPRHRGSSSTQHLAATSVLSTPSTSQFRSATSATLPPLEPTILPESVYLAAGQTEDGLAQTMRLPFLGPSVSTRVIEYNPYQHIKSISTVPARPPTRAAYVQSRSGPWKEKYPSEAVPTTLAMV
ncbi:hypothetical protein C8R46DRAFT_1200718 [Mycena filopes]|nr:hypothetical protein C8R46DRAFT_1200718 [Mycena filopes]